MIEAIIIGILVFAPISRGAVRIWAFGPIQMAIALTIFLWLYQMAKKKILIFKKTILDIPAIIFLLISVISLFYSKYLHDSLAGLFMWTTFFLLYYLIVNYINTEKKTAQIVGLIISIGFFLSFFGILQYFGGLKKPWWSNPKFLSSTYVNHNHFAGYLEMVIPLTVAILFTGSAKRGLRLILYYALFTMSFAFILTMSRGGWISLYISLSGMIFLLWQKKILIKEARFFLALIMIALIFFITSSSPGEEVFTRVATYRGLDLSGRLKIWQATLSMIKDYPLTGTGIGSFIHRIPKYRPEGLNMLINFAHNDFLHIASELGVFGLLALSYMLLAVVIRGIRLFSIAHTPIKKAIGLGIGSAGLSIAIHSLVDFNLHIPANAILFFVLSGVLINTRSVREAAPVFIKISLGRLGRVLSVFITTVIFIFFEIFVARDLFAEVYIGKGDRFMSRGEFFNANLAYQTSIALSPNNSKYYLKSAELYFKKASNNEISRDFWLEESERGFKRAIDINPFCGLAWLGLADLYKMENRLSEARYAIEKALEIDPNNSFYLKKLAEIALSSGDVELAFQSSLKVKEIEKKSASLSEIPSGVLDRDYYLKMAKLRLASGDTKQALNLFKIAEMISFSEEIKLNQLICYFKLGKLKEARERFKELKPNTKYKGIFLAQFSEYNLLKNHIFLAEALSEKAYRLNPKDPNVLFARFKVLKRLNKKAESTDIFTKILGLNKFDLNWKLINEGANETYFILVPGLYELEITARGEMARGEGPRMIASLNSIPILNLEINSEKPRVFAKRVEILNPENLVKVEFVNDFYDSKTGEDRNLFVDSVTFSYRDGD